MKLKYPYLYYLSVTLFAIVDVYVEVELTNSMSYVVART